MAEDKKLVEAMQKYWNACEPKTPEEALKIICAIGFTVMPREPTGEIIVEMQAAYERNAKWGEIYKAGVYAFENKPND